MIYEINTNSHWHPLSFLRFQLSPMLISLESWLTPIYVMRSCVASLSISLKSCVASILTVLMSNYFVHIWSFLFQLDDIIGITWDYVDPIGIMISICYEIMCWYHVITSMCDFCSTSLMPFELIDTTWIVTVIFLISVESFVIFTLTCWSDLICVYTCYQVICSDCLDI